MVASDAHIEPATSIRTFSETDTIVEDRFDCELPASVRVQTNFVNTERVVMQLLWYGYIVVHNR